MQENDVQKENTLAYWVVTVLTSKKCTFNCVI